MPFALTSGGANPGDFVRNVGRAVKEGGFAADAALRALTIDAAEILARAEADDAPFAASDELKAWVTQGLTELA